jgi:hypothetical protein
MTCGSTRKDLANPPQDDVNVRYELISIVSQRKVE